MMSLIKQLIVFQLILTNDILSKNIRLIKMWIFNKIIYFLRRVLIFNQSLSKAILKYTDFPGKIYFSLSENKNMCGSFGEGVCISLYL